MGPTASGRFTDVLWSSDRNSATEALIGVAVGYRDTLVNLLCRDINETANCFGEECNALIHRDDDYWLLQAFSKHSPDPGTSWLEHLRENLQFRSL